MKNESTKSLYGWLLYDFANSILLVNGGLYFSRWITDDLNAPSYTFNAIFIFSAVVVVVGSLLIGRYIDRFGPFKPLFLSTAIMCFGALFMSVAPYFISTTKILIITVSILFFLVITSYQISLISHNYFLKYEPLKNRLQENSSKGSIFNWLGSLVGIFLTVAFVGGEIFPSHSGNSAAFLPASVVTSILAIVSLYLIFTGNRNLKIPHEMSSSIKSFIVYFKNKQYVLFLVGAILILDTIFTIQLNLSQVMSTIHKVSPENIAPLFVLILLGAACGGYYSMKASYSASRRVLITSIVFGTLIVAVVLIPYDLYLYSVLFFLSGFCVGVLEPTLREGYSTLIQSKEAGIGFGLYNVVGRASIIIGPAILTILIIVLNNDAHAFTFSFFFLSAISVLGGLLIYKSLK